MITKKISLFIFSTFATLASFAQSIQGLGFSSDVVRPNESIKYTLVFKDASPDVKIQDIPIPQGLQFVGTSSENRISMSTQSGMTKEKRLVFNFVPTKAGDFEIPAWKIEFNGKTYDIPAAKFKADQNAPQKLNARSQNPFDDMDDFFGSSPLAQMMNMRRSAQSSRAQAPQEEIDLNKELSLAINMGKSEIFVGQAVEAKLVFKISKKIFSAGYTLAELVPSLKDSDSFQCVGFNKKPEIKEYPDKDFAEIIFDTTLIPLKAGELDLQFEANGVIASRDPFVANSFFGMRSMLGGQQFSVMMPTQKVAISELPKENMPSDFSGAIGSFKIDSASLDESSLSVGEPCTLTVKISGVGNFERMLAPILTEKDGWKEYKPKFSFADSSDGNSTKGVKTFEFTLLAKKPDLEFAPIVKFSYFDPSAKEYKTLSSEKIAVSVAPSKSYSKSKKAKDESASAEQNPLASVESSSKASSVQTLASNPIFWSAQLLILGIFVAFFIFKSKQNKLLENPYYAREVKAKKELKISLDKAKSAAKNSNAKDFFKAAENALKSAISMNSDIEFSAITLSDAQNILSQNQKFDGAFERVKYFFEGADAIAFAGLNPSGTELGSLYSELLQLCKTISEK